MQKDDSLRSELLAFMAAALDSRHASLKNYRIAALHMLAADSGFVLHGISDVISNLFHVGERVA